MKPLLLKARDLAHTQLLEVRDRFLPEQAIRVVGNRVQAASWQLRNPETNRTCHLVGMVHVGAGEYYQERSERLAMLRSVGTRVQYERIRQADADEVASASRLLQERLGQLRESKGKIDHRIMAEALGLKMQIENLVHPDGDENVDVSDLYLVKNLGLARFRQVAKTPDLSNVDKEALRSVLLTLMKHSAETSLLMEVIPGARRFHEVVLKERNEVALSAARLALRDGDVALVWGAAHLPGLRKELEADGFELEVVEWVDVCDLSEVSTSVPSA